MTKHVYCPMCGQRLMKGEEGSDVSVKCPRCERLIHVRIKTDGVVTELEEKIKPSVVLDTKNSAVVLK